MKQNDINQYIDEFKKVFLTKDDFDQRLNAILDTKLEEKLESKLDEKIKLLPTKNDFFTNMLKLLGEVEAMRKEQTLHSGQHVNIDDNLEEHRQRIQALEGRQKSSPSLIVPSL